MYSLIIPVYKNEESIPDLINALQKLQAQLDALLEVIFVIDGSPDNSFALLQEKLPQTSLVTTLVALSRNFGSFAAIKAGLGIATGKYFAVMAADLQEPPELILNFFKELSKNDVDVVLGSRQQRADPFFSRMASTFYWACYKKFIQKDMPAGGIDVFGCNIPFRDWLLQLNELNTSLVSQIIWLGFRRKFIPYSRLPRQHGKSAWLFSRKLRYLSDSIFSFSDLPIRLLNYFGLLGISLSIIFSVFLVIAKISGWIVIPGYTTTIMIILFMTAFNAFCLGIIGSYVWRAFENTKARPQAIIMLQKKFNSEKQL